MSLSTAREAISSSGPGITFPEVYASIARRASSPAETPSRRLISRSFFTLLRLEPHEPKWQTYTGNPTHTQPHTHCNSKYGPRQIRSQSFLDSLVSSREALRET